MMSPRRVIVVLEAEKLLVPKRESKAADAEQARLEEFLKEPPPHATIVFVCGALDMRRRVVKLLLKDGQVVDCGTVADDADAERWVKARAARDKVPVDAGAVRALVDLAGPDLVRLRSGLERVSLYALGQSSITASDVQQAVPAAPDAQADFGVAKAIWRNDARSALRELGLAMDAGTVAVMMMGQLRAAAEKLPAASSGRLETHPRVAWVNWPGLKSSPYYTLARKYFRAIDGEPGASSVMTFGIKGGASAGEKFIDGLQFLSRISRTLAMRNRW